MVRLLVSALLFLVHTHGFALVPITGVSRRSRAYSASLLSAVKNDVNFARRVVEKVHPSIALVTPMGVRNMTMQGTGFVVDPLSGTTRDEVYLLTAAHVAAPGYGLTVKFPGSKDPIGATVVARDVPTDLALIRVDAKRTNNGEKSFVSGEPLEFANEESEAATGSLVFANGYPGGITGGPAITMGVVCAMAEGFPIGNGRVEDTVLHANTTFVVTDAAMSGGMSGGPLVDVDGRVWGVNALVRPDMRALGNYAISAKTCQEFLDSIPSHKKEGSIHTETKPAGFRVVLYNDPMNKRERVARILREVAQLNEATANNVMMKAHTTGEGVVKEFPAAERRVDADAFCRSLREQDILVEVQEMVA